MNLSSIFRACGWLIAAFWASFAVWLHAAPYAFVPMSHAEQLSLFGAADLGCPLTMNRQCTRNPACQAPNPYGCAGDTTCTKPTGVCGTNNLNGRTANTYTNAALNCGFSADPNSGCYDQGTATVLCIDYVFCVCSGIQDPYRQNGYLCKKMGDDGNDDYRAACFQYVAQ